MHLDFALDMKQLAVASASDGIGTFTGYASTFGNIDRDNDIIEPGAFEMIDDPRSIKLLWQHDQRQPIGIWKVIKPDAKGLYVEGELNLATRQGAEAHALLKQGAIAHLSIGFRSKRGMVTFEEQMRDGLMVEIRRIKALTLYEISLVSMPANLRAEVGSVKSADGMTEREFEAFLRDAAGLSRRSAQTVIAKGFRALLSETTDATPVRDAGTTVDPSAEYGALLKAALQELTPIIKGTHS